MQARYDDTKLRFASACTPEFTNKWAKTITSWYKYIKTIVVRERAVLPNNEPDKQSLIK